MIYMHARWNNTQLVNFPNRHTWAMIVIEKLTALFGLEPIRHVFDLYLNIVHLLRRANCHCTPALFPFVSAMYSLVQRSTWKGDAISYQNHQFNSFICFCVNSYFDWLNDNNGEYVFKNRLRVRNKQILIFVRQIDNFLRCWNRFWNQ